MLSSREQPRAVEREAKRGRTARSSEGLRLHMRESLSAADIAIVACEALNDGANHSQSNLDSLALRRSTGGFALNAIALK